MNIPLATSISTSNSLFVRLLIFSLSISLDTSRLFNAGTRLVGITTEGMARQKILEGADITVIYPTDGTSAIPDATAIVKGSKHMENAKLFLEFTVSSDVQRLVEEVFFRRTVRNDMEEYAAREQTKLKTIDYDIHWASQEKEKILNTWETLQGRTDEKVD